MLLPGLPLLEARDEKGSKVWACSKPGGFGVGTTLALSDLEPGLYVLKVQARSRLGTDVSASREVQIRIAPPEAQK